MIRMGHIHKIVSGSPKPKPRIQMTTKGPSRKQVIIPMSSDNISKFMKNSSLHVASINRSLRNAKSQVLVDYIRSDASKSLLTKSQFNLIFTSSRTISRRLTTSTPSISTHPVYLKVLFKNYRPSLLSSRQLERTSHTKRR